ncbi:MULTISPECIES: hypothetical protein [unclassified Streptomyces]|uniref:hypothetical protein n=1 Tax=unclassified Streptomyces TaxID=2593676 RepID=UPI0036F5500F
MRLLARTTVNTLCALTLLGLAACGTGTSSSKDSGTSPSKTPAPFADMSGPEVVNKAIETTKKAKSMRLAIDTKSDEGPVSAHLTAALPGDCSGTMSIGPAGTIEIRKIGGTVYTKFDEAMLREQSKGEPAADVDAAVNMLAGRWMKSKASDPDSKDMLELCDLATMFKEFEANDDVAEKAGETTVDGKRALRLVEKDGEDTYTMLVAAEGEPYILQVDVRSSEEPTKMTLSDFDEPVEVKAPAPKDIVDPNNPTG